MTDDELSQRIRECQQKRGRMIRDDKKGTAEYQENDATEDKLLDELFTLRFGGRSKARTNSSEATVPNKGEPMIIKETQSYKLPTPGAVQGVLAEVKDLGMITTSWQGKERTTQKVLLTFEIDETVEREGQLQRMIVSRRFTASLNEKADLRKFLEGWRGRAFSDAELGGFDLDSIIGVNAILSLVHNKDGDKTYCNIDSATSLLKNMDKMSVSKDYLSYDQRMAKRQAAAAGVNTEHHPQREPGEEPPEDDQPPF